MHLLNRFRAISDLLNLFLFESFPISSQDIRTIDYPDPLRAVSKKKMFQPRISFEIIKKIYKKIFWTVNVFAEYFMQKYYIRYERREVFSMASLPTILP